MDFFLTLPRMEICATRLRHQQFTIQFGNEDITSETGISKCYLLIHILWSLMTAHNEVTYLLPTYFRLDLPRIIRLQH
ncbi:hypothetical protein ACHQM5_014972 [Ranunculus cassubicifolius]